jgi:rhodanese-related sulfurtransferase
VNYGPIPTVAVSDLPRPLPAGVAVLDVREKTEWVHGHIEGATHIPLRELVDRLDEVPHERTLVVCKVGGRSAHAVAYLTAHGRDAVNLAGGMIDWFADGRPMVSDTGNDPHVV